MLIYTVENAGKILRYLKRISHKSSRVISTLRLCDFLRDRQTADWPAEDTENKVEHEERSNDDETDEVDPRPAVTQRVIDLHIHKRHRRCCKL